MNKVTAIAFFVYVTLFVVVSGCNDHESNVRFVARVGSALLTEEDIALSLTNQAAFLDSSDAVSQIVEQWITNELLYQEALERGLISDPEVERLLKDNERSVLISTLVDRMTTADIGSGPDDDAIRTYYEKNREKLALREPYVQIRHLVLSSPDSAEVLWKLVSEMATDALGTAQFKALALNYSREGPLPDAYYPQSQLFAGMPGVVEAISRLSPGETLPVIPHAGRYHIVQLIDKIDAGSIPAMEMIINNLRDRVTIQMRKQLYARQVQRLRTRSLARDELEIK